MNDQRTLCTICGTEYSVDDDYLNSNKTSGLGIADSAAARRYDRKHCPNCCVIEHSIPVPLVRYKEYEALYAKIKELRDQSIQLRNRIEPFENTTLSATREERYYSEEADKIRSTAWQLSHALNTLSTITPNLSRSQYEPAGGF